MSRNKRTFLQSLKQPGETKQTHFYKRRQNVRTFLNNLIKGVCLSLTARKQRRPSAEGQASAAPGSGISPWRPAAGSRSGTGRSSRRQSVDGQKPPEALLPSLCHQTEAESLHTWADWHPAPANLRDRQVGDRQTMKTGAISAMETLGAAMSLLLWWCRSHQGWWGQQRTQSSAVCRQVWVGRHPAAGHRTAGRQTPPKPGRGRKSLMSSVKRPL